MTRSSSRCSKGRRRRSMTFWQCPGQKVCHEGFLGSNSLAVKGLRDRRGTLRLLSSSFLGVPYRILNMNHKKELLRSLWVRFRFGGSAREAEGVGEDRWTRTGTGAQALTTRVQNPRNPKPHKTRTLKPKPKPYETLTPNPKP